MSADAGATDAGVVAALRALRDGRLADAEAAARSAVAANPADGAALHLLAIATHRAGRQDEALDLVGRASAIDPKNADYLNTQGHILRVLRRHEEAISVLQRAVSLRPDHAEVLNNLGIALAEAGDATSAEKCYRDAIALRPRFPEAQNNLGSLLHAAGRTAEALAAYDAATTLRPDYAEAHANRGDVLVRDRRDDDAARAYAEALAAAPAWADVAFKLGSALYRTGRFEEAHRAFLRAIDVEPDNTRYLTALAAALEKLSRYEEAALFLRHAILLAPDDPGCLKNLGHVVLKLGHVGEGLHLLRRAVALAPNDVDAVYSLGNALLRMERLQEALDCYTKVRELTPEAARAYFAPASVLLMSGRYREGWAAYESRFEMTSYRCNIGNPLERLWDGGPLKGRRLLVHVEQGFGDTFMFLRYLPLLRERLGPDERIILLCEPELARIAETVDGPNEVHSLRSGGQVQFDVQVPLMSLPHRLGTLLDTIPAQVPYLGLPPGTAARVVRPKGTRVAVAFVWAGRPTHSDDRFRSCPLQWFATLFDVPGVHFYSIQWGPRVAELAPYADRGNVTDMSASLSDFAETLAVIDGVDLVIAIDTAVAHLAGAYGKLVWTLLPFGGEWRWLYRREDSPWYPTMRLFRQRILGDWRPVFLRLRTALAELAERRGVAASDGTAR